MRPRLVLLGVALMTGCSGDDASEAPSTEAARAEQRESAPAPLPPDAGTRTGHGADRRRVNVPERDSSPPTVRITLAGPDGTRLATTSWPRPTHPPTVDLDAPRLRGTTTGADRNGGVARVRVSIREQIECRHVNREYRRLRTRYFPPPQIERIRSNPGARLPTRAVRAKPLELGGTRCGAGRPAAVHGELWGEAINGSGLEAVTPHLRFVYEVD